MAVYVAHAERRGLYSGIFCEKLKSRDHLEDPGVDRSIILQCTSILRKQERKLCNGLLWFGTETNGEVL